MRKPFQCLEGRPFTALLLDDDRKRANALSVLLSRLNQPSIRVVRMGSSMRSRLTLEHILLQVTGQEGNTSLADNARRIACMIADRQRQETSVVLLITQAETLHSKTLRLLQAMAPYFAEDGTPTLQVVFVGRPEFRALLDARGMTPLRDALRLPASIKVSGPSAADGLSVPSSMDGQPGPPEPPPITPFAPLLELSVAESAATPIPATWRRNPLVRLLLLLAIVTAAIAIAYLGLRAVFYRDVPARSIPIDVLSAEPQSPMIAHSPASPMPLAPALDPSGPTPLAPAVAAPVLAPRPAPPGNLVPSITVVPASPSDPLEQLHGDLGARSATPEPRIVIHAPAGSEGAAALSAYLLASLGPRPGTVEARRVPDTPNRPSIRYFHPEDEPAARQVAAWMADTGLPWTLRDFSTFLPRPSRGTIEVWLPRQ